MTEDNANTPETTDAPAPEATSEPTETPADTAAEAPVVETPAPAPTRTLSPGTPPDGHWWWGTGRRKASTARVRIRPGKGEFTVNKRPVAEYFTAERDQKDLETVLQKTGTHGSVEVHVNVNGGGTTGQAGAIILGLGRALLRYDGSLEPVLRDNNYLTRDPRKVERKKYGQAGARRRFQFSKR